ncbi:MAG: DUF6958 family protein [Aggregatilineales bacterium]
MSDDNRIQLHHPAEGIEGMMMDKGIYETIREVILACIKQEGEVSFAELQGKVESDISTYESAPEEDIPAVALDLEAHGILKRNENSRPFSLKIADGAKK